MAEKKLTDTEATRAKLAVARERRRAAARHEAVLVRQIKATDRRLAAQQKITLGAALLRAVSAHPSAVPGLIKLLDQHVTRDVDRACLRDTPLALPESKNTAARSPAESSGA